MEDNNFGILYCATGKRYLRQATLSAQSVKKFSQKIPCSVCTDELVSGTLWDQIIPIPKSKANHDQYMIDKLITLTKSPYDTTLYLDSDTYVLDDLTELFTVLDKFDLALCHGHDRQKRYDIQHGKIPHNGILRNAITSSIPYAFSPIQGGLLLYKKNEKVKKWLNDLLSVYQLKRFYDDQVSIRELLWTSDIRFYVLPPEYNFNSLELLRFWKRNNFRNATPKIFHYTMNKDTNIESLIMKIYNPGNLDSIEYKKKFLRLVPEKFRNLIKSIFF